MKTRALVQKRSLILGVICLLALVCFAIYYHTANRRRNAGHFVDAYSLSSYTLNSNQPFQKITVPFVLDDDGLIHVKVVFSNKPYDCILDTGSNDVSWPSWMHLAGKRLNETWTGSDAGGNTASGEVVILNHIRLGGYEVNDLPTDMLGGKDWHRPTHKEQQSGVGTSHLCPILGNAFFAHVVLTIDYENCKLIIARPEYNLTAVSHSPQIRECEFLWSSGHHLIIPGRLDGLSVSFAIDTGWGTDAIGVNLMTYLPQSKAATNPGAFGTVQDRIVPSMNWSLNCIGHLSISRKTPALILQDTSSSLDFDAIIGSDFLQDYTVTIDYPRQKIYFDPQ